MKKLHVYCYKWILCIKTEITENVYNITLIGDIFSILLAQCKYQMILVKIVVLKIVIYFLF